MEKEVSDKIEQAVQQLAQLKEVESKSDRGLSVVTVRIKDKYDKFALPQVWDELRRKVGDVQSKLPPGAGPSIVNDDYGDVFGVFVAIYGDQYSDAELKEYAKFLRRELLLVPDVSKIELWGERTEAVYVEPIRDRMSQLGIHPMQIVEGLRDKNIVSDAGRTHVGPSFIAVETTGTITSVREFEDLLLSGVGESGKGQIYLRDVANVRRGYVEPATQVLRYDAHPAVGMGISTVSGGNVVTMGAAVEKRARELLTRTPLGIDFGIISLQSDAVTTAIDSFLMSLAQAVAIVIVVLLVFMGVRSGLIIGFILALTICGTFIFMGPWDVALERISLGALIIALGMLVDNAIVVVDGVLVRTRKGQDTAEAAGEVVAQTSMPLLGATAVAIMAFGAIGLSEDATGEFCRSLFRVVFISLGLSWITAVTVTPLLCVMFPKAPKPGSGEQAAEESDPYAGALYTAYRSFLGLAIRLRYITVLVVVGMFAVSLWGFQFVDKTFFPNSTRPQFMLDFWLPQGTHIEDTMATATDVEKYLLEQDGATHVTTLGGAGGLRFLLTYAPEKVNSAYAQFLIDVDDYTKIDDLIAQAEQELPDLFVDSEVYGRKFILGPGGGGKIQIRFSGPDPETLRALASETINILYEDGDAKAVRTDWRQQVKVIRPVVAEEEANYAGVATPDVALTIAMGFEGEMVGVYREGDELLPIIVRALEPERSQVQSIQNLQIWSPAAQQNIPLRQVVSKFETDFEDEIVQRLNRKSTITVHADPNNGTSSSLLRRIRPKVEALEKGPDYEIEWWGEYRDSTRAQAGIAASLPFFLLFMVLIVIGLFNALRQPLAIWLCVLLAIFGLMVATVLTMIVVPVFYAIFFRVPYPSASTA